jgi:hypothetical protein
MWHPQCITVTANDNGDNEKANDRFEKLLEATCLNHSYPVKHELKDYTMMTNFMTWGPLSKGRKPEGA